LELEKAKSENVGLELINIVNENKALHQELNDIYKKSGSTNEENAKYINKYCINLNIYISIFYKNKKNKNIKNKELRD
jgi:hypothetical protein